MDIMELLGVRRYLIVLNKCDLVDEEWLRMVEEEIRGEVRGSILEEAPIIRASAVTGEGIDSLKEQIAGDGSRDPRRPESGRCGAPSCRQSVLGSRVRHDRDRNPAGRNDPERRSAHFISERYFLPCARDPGV